MSRPTFPEITWPLDEAAIEVAENWAHAASELFIEWLWRSFHTLLEEAPVLREPSPDFEAFERSLTNHHFIYLSRLVGKETAGFATFTVHHEMPELESRKAAPAMPPAYDIAFVWNENPRVAWPVEAKVLPTPRTLAPYLGDTHKLTTSGAPFCGAAAQIAYLCSGDADVFFENLSNKINFATVLASTNTNRPQHISYHPRLKKPTLKIHHLLMSLGR